MTYFILLLTMFLFFTWLSVLAASAISFLPPSQKKPDHGDHSTVYYAANRYVHSDGGYEQ